jgi:hypothetical protein
MEKAFQLDQKEMVQLQQVDQERTQALAMVGALSLDMEQARKNLDAAAERQRSFIKQVLANRGVERYESARAQNGAIIALIPDAPPFAVPPTDGPKAVERVNGPMNDTAVRE